MNQIDTLSVNAIRILSADAIQKANSGIRDFRWDVQQRLMNCGHII